MGTASASFTVTYRATDSVAGFGTLPRLIAQRQRAQNSDGGQCLSWANDPTAGSSVAGTTGGTALTSAQTLVAGYCYRWTLAASDMNGNAAATLTSATVIVDVASVANKPVGTFLVPQAGPVATRNTTASALRVTWNEAERASGVLTRSLQRYKLAATAATSCTGDFAADGSAVTSATLLNGAYYVDQALASSNCYYWQVTLTDRAGNLFTSRSGYVFVRSNTDTTAVPMPTFTAPAPGAISYQSSGSYSVAWTEAAGNGTITGRSLQRQKASGTFGSVDGLTWADDGAADTGASPRPVTALAQGMYRWVETLTNSNGRTGAAISGWVVVDTAAPSGAIAAPVANDTLASDLTITGTADDAGSFLNYSLDYGVGASPATWIPIGTYTNPVANGLLGTLPTAGLSGAYSIRLTVRERATSTSTTVTRVVGIEAGRRGDESYYTRAPYDLGGGLSLDVGVANGEVRLARETGQVPSYGPPQDLALTYSSLEATATGKLGYGWNSTLTQYPPSTPRARSRPGTAPTAAGSSSATAEAPGSLPPATTTRLPSRARRRP
ncbi:MAG: hypothetical protein U0838_05690 [Chloroflexota bacterium]